MNSYELTHFKKMVRVWKTKSQLFCLRYDPLIVLRRQDHLTLIFIKMITWPLSLNGLLRKEEQKLLKKRLIKQTMSPANLTVCQETCILNWIFIFSFMQISRHTCYYASRVTFLPIVYLACVYWGEGSCVHRLQFIKTVEVTTLP